MAKTPASVRVTVDSEELRKLQERYSDRINTQRIRIDRHIRFLEDQGLLEKFNEWESSLGE